MSSSPLPHNPDPPPHVVPASLPVAVVTPLRQPAWIWLIPAAALLLALLLGWRAWHERGILVEVQLPRGNGLRPGDDVRYRGVTVGQIAETALAGDLEGVLVRATLQPQARNLARAGSRFWVVRPELGLQGVVGLDTLVGPRYLAVLPGDGPPQYSFVGLENPPIVESIRPGDLEIVLQTRQREGLRPGAPVLYREVRVGVVLSVGLTSDSGAVEARIHIEQPYAPLIREQTRFWPAGGLDLEVGFSGMKARMETLETLLVGGVALATPPRAGEPVRNGHRFTLAPRGEAEWLTWDPLIAIGSSYLPPGSKLPTPLRAVSQWKAGTWLGGADSRRGWVLQTEDGLLGPADLLAPPSPEAAPDFSLDVGGRTIPTAGGPSWSQGGVALLPTPGGAGGPAWPERLRRRPTAPEDCLAIADPAAAPLPLSAARLRAEGEQWWIDPSIPLDESWHGACVLARSDAKLVGMVLVDAQRPRVVLIRVTSDK